MAESQGNTTYNSAEIQILPDAVRVATGERPRQNDRSQVLLQLAIRGALILIALTLLVWPFLDQRFRDSEGNLTGIVFFSEAAGIGTLLVASTLRTVWFKASLWFSLMLIGQAVTFQLVDAGWQLRYQHYKPLGELVEGGWVGQMAAVLAIQAAIAIVGLRRVVPTIFRWCRSYLRWWQYFILIAFFVLPAATVSPNVANYFKELAFAVFVQTVHLLTAICFAISLPSFALNRLRSMLGIVADHEAEERSGSPMINRFAIALAIFAAVTAALLCVVSYERHPHVPDEVAYIIQSRFFASGALTLPAPPVPEAFDVYLMKVVGDQWYSVPPPGWPLILALGSVFGLPWLVNPILAGLNILLAYFLLRELFASRIAQLAILLLTLSPWYLFLGMSFMTHMLSLTCMLLAALGVALSRKNDSTLWAIGAGFSIGMISLVRPLEAVAIAGLLGLWSIGIGGKRLKTNAIIGMVLGAVCIGAVGLAYNAALTGDPMKFPINVYTDEHFGNNSNAYGFGPDRGMGWAQDPYPGHGPVDALVNSNLNASAINIELFGWGLGSLLLVGFGLCLGKLGISEYLMIAVIAVIYGLHFFYYFSGGPDFGARYWFLMIVPLVVLAARGVRELAKRIESEFDGQGVRVYVTVLALCFSSAVLFIPWRAADKYHNFRGMRPDIRFLAEQIGFGRSLVLIQGNKHPDYDSAMIYNPLDLRSDSPIYAWDRDLVVRRNLLLAYADRPVWIVRSPSLTNAGYQVAAGPLSVADLVGRGY